ncbi:hypothetical protein LINPERHAP1_LOCUS14238, partial [Linum perenne]
HVTRLTSFQNLKYGSLILTSTIVYSKQTKYGDWYDCVDFYEQPAFDHPLLKDHKYEYKIFMQMSSSRYQASDEFGINPFDIWLNGKGCPDNTVPIKRVTKEDLIRINKVTELAYRINDNPGVQVNLSTAPVPEDDDIYYGGGMNAGIFHPAVQKNQYSSSRMSIISAIESISVGWTVNPSLYPDNQTHLFIYTITKDLQCYNTYCPGFIRMSSRVPPDIKLNIYPEIGKSVWAIPLFVYKDVESGDYFFNVGSDNFTVGSWPQKIFTGLADSISTIEWGGEVYSPPGTTPPPMGAGHVPENKPFNDCYDASIRIINEYREFVNDPPGCEKFQTSSSYRVNDVGIAGPALRTIFFGGAYGQ